MNFRVLLSLTLATTISAFAAEKSRYELEKEQKERWRKESEQEVAASEQPLDIFRDPKTVISYPYPQSKLTKENLLAKQDALTPDEQFLLDLLIFSEQPSALQNLICSYLGWHEVGQFKGHDGAVNVITTYVDSKKQKYNLISGGQDGTVKIWDIRTQTCEYTIPSRSGEVTALATCCRYRDKAIILAVAYGADIKIFEITEEKARFIKVLTGNASKIIYLNLHNDSHDHITLTSYGVPDHITRDWDIATGQSKIRTSFFFFSSTPYSITHNAGTDSKLFEWDDSTHIMQCIRLPEHKPTAFSDDAVYFGDVNPITQFENQLENQEDIDLYNEILAEAKAAGADIENYTVPTQGVFASGDMSGTIYIWDIMQPPSCLCTLTGHAGKITGLQWIETAALHLISASEDGTIRLWAKGTLPADITKQKKSAENPGYLSGSDSDNDLESEDEQE